MSEKRWLTTIWYKPPPVLLLPYPLTAQVMNIAGEKAVPLSQEHVKAIWQKYGNGLPRHQFFEQEFLTHAGG